MYVCDDRGEKQRNCVWSMWKTEETVCDRLRSEKKREDTNIREILTDKEKIHIDREVEFGLVVKTQCWKMFIFRSL